MFKEILAKAAHAQLQDPPDVGLPQEELPKLLVTVTNYFLLLVAALALAYLVYGGFAYMTSGGDSTKATAAKRVITYAIAGIILIGVAAALVNFVAGAFAQ